MHRRVVYRQVLTKVQSSHLTYPGGHQVSSCSRRNLLTGTLHALAPQRRCLQKRPMREVEPKHASTAAVIACHTQFVCDGLHRCLMDEAISYTGPCRAIHSSK